MDEAFKVKKIYTDFLIIGGGAAGLFASISGAKKSTKQFLVVDKANVKRSGCLAAGVNALNTYIAEGEDVMPFVNNVKSEFKNIVREDLAYTIGKKLHKVTKAIEEMGLTILKDAEGNYAKRGKRSIKINGENIKEVLATETKKYDNIQILNNVNISDYIYQDDKVIGAIGFSVRDCTFYVLHAAATLIATGGASGIYKGNSLGISRHKMWYCPFNTGAGYAMGIRIGAEFTSFEMRFVALRTKGTISPTGTVAQGISAPMINNLKEPYAHKYNAAQTVKRLYGATQETQRGRGPCYIQTEGITSTQKEELIKAYLNMAPLQVLYWQDNNIDITKQNIEITGTEPYIVGGHSVSGYWVDINRQTTIPGLYAAGDVVGGCGKKYVTGAFAEGEIAIHAMIEKYNEDSRLHVLDAPLTTYEEGLIENLSHYLVSDSNFSKEECLQQIEQLEETMQCVMDKYAGGISCDYAYTEENLAVAQTEILSLLKRSDTLRAYDFYQLLLICEVRDRLYVALVLIEHLKARKETRIQIYNQNDSYKEENPAYEKYINSVYRNGQVNIITRPLVQLKAPEEITQ